MLTGEKCSLIRTGPLALWRRVAFPFLFGDAAGRQLPWLQPVPHSVRQRPEQGTFDHQASTYGRQISRQTTGGIVKPG